MNNNIFKLPNIENPMGKKGFIPMVFNVKFLLIALVLVAGIYVAYNSGILNSSPLGIYDSDTFVKPLWARLECAAEDFQTTHTAYLAQQTLFKCDANTEICNFQVYNDFSPSILARFFYQECNNNGLNCGTTTQKNGVGTWQLPTINNGRSYKFSTDAYGESNHVKVTQSYSAYKLFRFFGGAKDIVNSFDCTLRSGDLSKVRSVDYTGPKLSRTGGVGQKWINYVDDWVYGPATNIVTYNGQKAYCSNARVYSIVKLQMKDGNLVQIDPTYSATLPSGASLNGLGSILANVECCPNEPNCGDDFKFDDDDDDDDGTGGGDQCFSDLQCFNAGGPVPISGTQYVQYKCLAGACQKQGPFNVQCTTNAQCANGEICDLSTLNYGKCIKQNQGPYCGDGVCQSNENVNLCPADCEFACPTGQHLVTKTTHTFWSLIGITEPTEIKYCDSFNFWEQYGKWVVLGIALLLILVFLFVKRSIPAVISIIILAVIYLSYIYLGTFATTFLVVIAGIGFMIYLFRHAIFSLLRFAL